MPRALRTIVFLLLLAGWCLSAGQAFAEKRVALIIGSSNYEKAARLPNPANDAALIAETFKSASFDNVDLRRDLTVGVMRRTLRDFTRLGVALGAEPATFAGLAGMGDLILTATGPLSRNHQLGAGLGSGQRLA